MMIAGFERIPVRWHEDRQGRPYAKQTGRIAERAFRHRLPAADFPEPSVLFDAEAFGSILTTAGTLELIDMLNGSRYIFNFAEDTWWFRWRTAAGDKIVIRLDQAAEVVRP